MAKVTMAALMAYLIRQPKAMRGRTHAEFRCYPQRLEPLVVVALCRTGIWLPCANLYKRSARIPSPMFRSLATISGCRSWLSFPQPFPQRVSAR